MDTELLNGKKEKGRRREPISFGQGLITLLCLIVLFWPVYLFNHDKYPKERKIVEATSIIGAIITSEKLEMQRNPSQGFYSAYTLEDFQAKGLDLSDMRYFSYKVEASRERPATSFIVTATGIKEYREENPSECWIKYYYSTDDWSSDGECIKPDMLPY